jgi:hypothetical protein
MESGQLATSDFAPRTNRDTARDEATAVIASEAKQPSLGADVAMDCFATLAMAIDGAVLGCTKQSPSSRTSEARCGTHNHRRSFARKSSNSVCRNERHGVWVPASVGTTAMSLTPSRLHDRAGRSNSRHCERSEAIQLRCGWGHGLLRCARNDDRWSGASLHRAIASVGAV